MADQKPEEEVHVISPRGERGTVPASQLSDAINRYGFRRVSDVQLQEEAKQEALQADPYYSGTAGKGRAYLAGLIEGVPFGIGTAAVTSEPMAKWSGYRNSDEMARQLELLRQANPKTSGFAEQAMGVASVEAVPVAEGLGLGLRAGTRALERVAPETAASIAEWLGKSGAKAATDAAKVATPADEATAEALTRDLKNATPYRGTQPPAVSRPPVRGPTGTLWQRGAAPFEVPGAGAGADLGVEQGTLGGLGPERGGTVSMTRRLVEPGEVPDLVDPTRRLENTSARAPGTKFGGSFNPEESVVEQYLRSTAPPQASGAGLRGLRDLRGLLADQKPVAGLQELRGLLADARSAEAAAENGPVPGLEGLQQLRGMVQNRTGATLAGLGGLPADLEMTGRGAAPAALEATGRGGRIGADLEATGRGAQLGAGAGNVRSVGEAIAANPQKQVGDVVLAELLQQAAAGDPAAARAIAKLTGKVAEAPSATGAAAADLFKPVSPETLEARANLAARLDALSGTATDGLPQVPGARLGTVGADAIAAVKGGGPRAAAVLGRGMGTPADEMVRGMAMGASDAYKAIGAREAGVLERALMANPQSAKAISETAASMVWGAAFGAGNAVNEQLLTEPHDVSAEKVVWGALAGAGTGLLFELGIKGLGAMAKGARASAAAGEVVGPSVAGFLRDAEARAGMRAVLRDAKNVPPEMVDRIGGPTATWDRIKRLFKTDAMSAGELANLGSRSTLDRANGIMDAVRLRQGSMHADLDRIVAQKGGAVTVGDMLQVMDNVAGVVSRDPFRGKDVEMIAALKRRLAEADGVRAVLGTDGQAVWNLDKPMPFSRAQELVDMAEQQLAHRSSGEGTPGEALKQIRDDWQKVIDAKAHTALEGSGGRLAEEYANVRKDLDAARMVRDAARSADDGMFHSNGPVLDSVNRVMGIRGAAYAAVGMAIGGHPGAWLIGNFMGRLGASVWEHYGEAISAKAWGKLANLAAIETGSAVAEARLAQKLEQAVAGKGSRMEAGAFDHEATVAAMDSITNMPPEEIHRRAMELGNLVSEDAPSVGAHMTMTAMNALGYLRSVMPKPVDMPLRLAHDEPIYSHEDLVVFADQLRVVQDPHTIVDAINDRSVSKEQAQAVQAVYPVFYAQTRKAVQDYLFELNTPFQERYQLGWVFDIPADPLLDPGMVIEIDNARQTVQVGEAKGPGRMGPVDMTKIRPGVESQVIGGRP